MARLTASTESCIMHKVIKAVLVLIVVLVLVAFVRDSQLNQQQLELKSIEVKDTSLELKQLNEKYDEELNKSKSNQETIDQLNKEKEELSKQLQAKQEAKAKLAQQKLQASQSVQAAPAAPVSGNWVAQCHAWAAQAGVSLNNAAIKLLERESHCNPLARNPNSSAGGIPQALPYTKMGCPLSAAGAPCQIKWFQGYVLSRYGSFDAALAHSYAKNWY